MKQNETLTEGRKRDGCLSTFHAASSAGTKEKDSIICKTVRRSLSVEVEPQPGQDDQSPGRIRGPAYLCLLAIGHLALTRGWVLLE